MSNDRYARHKLIDWFSQDKVQQAQIAVVGAGAVGNEVIKNLTLLGVGAIDVFDFDIIEAHNLTKSVLFRNSDVGRPKAEVAASRAQELDTNVRITAYNGDFWDTLTFSKLDSYNVIICCVDNVEARIRLNRLCLLLRRPLINCGIDSRYSMTTLYPFDSDPESACYECSLDDAGYARAQERYSCQAGGIRKIAHRNRTVPTTIVTSSVTAAYAVSWALQFARGLPPIPRTTSHFTDTISGKTTLSEQRKRSLCAGCGRFALNSDRISLKRLISRKNLTDFGADASSSSLYLSDPILVGYSTRSSGSHRNFVKIFRRASDFDEASLAKLLPPNDEVELEVRDTFSVDELLQRFEGERLPSKWGVVSDSDRSWFGEFQEAGA